ncbi:hypothetical protein EAY03_19200, partial [Vibrio anguillarum]|nr:hypothetical protein [Vibrio anguillarum]
QCTRIHRAQEFLEGVSTVELMSRITQCIKSSAKVVFERFRNVGTRHNIDTPKSAAVLPNL